MGRRSSEFPTPLELEILKVLWERSPLPVRDVQEALASGRARRQLSYSSVITVMNIMVGKQFLERQKQGKAFFYHPAISRKRVHRGVLADLLDRVFDGSPKAMLLELLDTADIDENELEELRRLVQRESGGESP